MGEPEKNDKITINNFKVTLNEVSFVPLPSSTDGDLGVNTRDEIIVDNASLDGIKLTFTRSISLNPEAIFKIGVKYSLEAEFINESKDFFSKSQDVEIFKKWAEKRKVEIINDQGIPAKASVIISAISFGSTGFPIITPPMFFQKKEDQVN
jgi:hypothetical protein